MTQTTTFEDDTDEKERYIKQALSNATDNGISEEFHAELESILKEHSDVLRIRLGEVPPAALPPMFIDLLDYTRPVRAAQHRYPPAKREFLEGTTDKLLELGFLRRSL